MMKTVSKAAATGDIRRERDACGRLLIAPLLGREFGTMNWASAPA
jgi:hypothetical protein